MEIQSLTHPLVRHLMNLRQSGSYRNESNTVLLIGEKLVLQFPFLIHRIFSEEPVKVNAEEHFFVPQKILEKISGIKGFKGPVAEVKRPEERDLSRRKSLLILDQLQDPGNLGTLLRTAHALGWGGVVATPGTVDFFNDKVLRASQGALFHLPFAYKTPKEIASWDYTFWAADAKGEDLEKEDFEAPLALILSNEGQGLSPWAKKRGKRLSIPLKKNAESLNVATAGAILLYKMIR